MTASLGFKFGFALVILCKLLYLQVPVDVKLLNIQAEGSGIALAEVGQTWDNFLSFLSFFFNIYIVVVLEICHWHFIFWVFAIILMLFLGYIMQLYVYLDIDIFQYWRGDWGFLLWCECDSFWRDYQRIHSQSLRPVSCSPQCKVTVLRIPCSLFSNQFCSLLKMAEGRQFRNGHDGYRNTLGNDPRHGDTWYFESTHVQT